MGLGFGDVLVTGVEEVCSFVTGDLLVTGEELAEILK